MFRDIFIEMTVWKRRWKHDSSSSSNQKRMLIIRYNYCSWQLFLEFDLIATLDAEGIGRMKREVIHVLVVRGTNSDFDGKPKALLLIINQFESAEIVYFYTLFFYEYQEYTIRYDTTWHSTLFIQQQHPIIHICFYYFTDKWARI